MRFLKAKTRWVQGHTGDVHNERCDELANFGRTGEAKKEKKPKAPKEPEFVVYIKNSLLYANYNGKIKEIDLEKNTIVDYNQ